MAVAIPESTLPYPPVYKDKRFVVLSDWFSSTFLILGPKNLTGRLQGRHDHDAGLE
jgi:hypothetical protein